MTREAWTKHRLSVVNQALRQTIILPKILATFPVSDTYNISTTRVLILIILWLLSGYQIFVKSKWSVVNVKYSLCSTILLFSLLNFHAVILVCLLSIKKVTKLREIQNILNGVEFTIQAIGAQWQYELKWYKLNVNLIFIICVQSLAFIIDKDHEEFMEYSFRFASLVFVDLGVAVTLNLVCGLLGIIENLMFQIKFVDDSNTQLKLNEKLLYATGLVNELFGPQLFLITSGILISSSGIIYLLCMNMFVLSAISLFLALMRYISLLGQLITATNGILNKVDEINEHFYKKLATNPRDEILEFHLTSKKNSPMSAAGFFDINNALVVSMITATTTYMILLMQYSP